MWLMDEPTAPASRPVGIISPNGRLGRMPSPSVVFILSSLRRLHNRQMQLWSAQVSDPLPGHARVELETTELPRGEAGGGLRGPAISLSSGHCGYDVTHDQPTNDIRALVVVPKTENHAVAIIRRGLFGKAGMDWRTCLNSSAHRSLPCSSAGALAANVVAQCLVGVAVAFFGRSHPLSGEWRLVVVTGLMGGFSTSSTFSAEGVGDIHHGKLA